MEQVPKVMGKGKPLTMDKAYEGDACRAKAVECGMVPLVPPKSNRKEPWEYDKDLYKGRNVVERNFRNIKEFRRVYTAMKNSTKPIMPSSPSKISSAS